MQSFRLADSEIQLSRIIFGCWAMGGWFWGGSRDADSIRAVHAALDAGVFSFDTAPVYGFGHSETILGQAIHDRRDRVVIATKFGLRWSEKSFPANNKASDSEVTTDARPAFSVQAHNSGLGCDHPLHNQDFSVYHNLRAESIIQECEDSLRRLQTDYIDLYQVHWPDDPARRDWSEVQKALIRLREAGKIRAAGVSNFTVENMESWRKSGSVPIAADQEKYNLLHHKPEQGNLPYLRKRGIPLLAYSPLAQGLLTGKRINTEDLPEDDWRRRRSLFADEIQDKIQDASRKLKEIRIRYEITDAGLALAFLLHAEGVGGVICGMRNPDQLRENIRAASIALERTDQAEIANIWMETGVRDNQH